MKKLQRIAESSGTDKTLDYLEHHFRRDQNYFKLFEVLKMRCRHRMNLPLIYSQQPDVLDESQQRELEDGLLDACREIGTLFFKAGQFQEGWMYLQPVGDKSLNEKLVQTIVPDEENLDALIEIAVTQGAAVEYGYGLLLKNYGTCNGITTFDTQAMRFERPVQREMASVLLRHIYDELAGNVRYAIGQPTENQNTAPLALSGEMSQADLESASLADLMAAFPTLTEGGAHHIDTTHLASIMRIARLVESSDDLQKATELAAYGLTLHEDFQYPSNPPFENTYVDHHFFYEALLGRNVDSAVNHFKAKIEDQRTDELGPVAEETLVDLLVRVGRRDEAISVVIKRLLGKHESLGIAPSAFEIAESPSSLQQLQDFYEDDDDLLGYAVSFLKRTGQPPSP